MTSFKLFKYDMLIKEHHLDSFGHVNNAVYLEILEEARWEIVTPRGFGLKTIHEMGIGPIILEWNLKFLKELQLRQKIIIETQMIAYKNKIGTMRQNILNDAGVCCCQAIMTFGLFDMKLRKLILPTPLWLEAVGLTA